MKFCQNTGNNADKIPEIAQVEIDESVEYYNSEQAWVMILKKYFMPLNE